jgi:hypothetical protein
LSVEVRVKDGWMDGWSDRVKVRVKVRVGDERQGEGED